MTQNTEILQQPTRWHDWGQALHGGETRNMIVMYTLVALLVMQAAFIGWTYWPKATTATASEPLFAELTTDKIASLVITDDKEKQIRLAQNDTGEWILPDAGDFPVNAAKVEPLLEKMTELTTGRLVASNEASYARLSVADDDFMRRIDMTLDDGTTHTLYIGTSPRTRATHVRSGEQEAVYLAANLRSSDAGVQPRNWIDTIYFQVPEADIQTLHITNANGDLEFTKAEDGEWAMANLADGEEFNDNNLVSMVSSLTSLNMVEPLGTAEIAAYGMAEPNAVVTLTTTDADGESQTHTLTIGAKAEMGNHYIVKSSDSDYFVHVSGHTIDRFIERGHSDFIKPPEEAAATDDATASASEEPILGPLGPLTWEDVEPFPILASAGEQSTAEAQ